ncbi:Mitochondrial import inner membrane translocase subunit-like protein [Hapsidospora chrysogenum ATCC 11550]|uniref:Mitochondrial import inner membrane translocase subunit n=1 Tax=Hapsidospora chrysogenum (strain ATCC 11550 / CBS 779.69 / DSM 880 / IAM 14645 / JCM 23072 / IMI 49137) TaxID=857340 RepID=A0A086T176_HAPC1|nr:Mitochondrial import inner membrane translocase subunit-like protein [Hapsidospora chrysogenum ATCC 11550]
MNSTTAAIDNLDIERLNDSDKGELRQFLQTQQQRSQIQSQTHQLTQICWTKCVTSNIKSGKLDKNEEGCLANCVNRFMDLNFLTVKHLNTMRGA